MAECKCTTQKWATIIISASVWSILLFLLPVFIFVSLLHSLLLCPFEFLARIPQFIIHLHFANDAMTTFTLVFALKVLQVLLLIYFHSYFHFQFQFQFHFILLFYVMENFFKYSAKYTLVFPITNCRMVLSIAWSHDCRAHLIIFI